MKKLFLLGLIFACCTANAATGSEKQVEAQRTRGCVNSIPGICRVPIYALFSPYAERLYGEKVDVVGYLRLRDEIWVLYPDRDSAQYAIAERGIFISFDDKINFEEKYTSKRYVQIRGRFQLSSDAMFWAEIVLSDPPQEVPFASDGPFEPAPPKPADLPD